ncbi:hypothetical protein G7Z17_g5303 [Cylindrodendrum hubeiense]|uniref:BZIP domain-containing protein n=1 Tax=Cylindrodendrum hubeiense TaxID=595255 RepID=A0A9P5HCB4_9HYPO|nr:hypothetical protein G7Z17_g5303 [Cylindrodendrum hubeiense]
MTLSSPNENVPIRTRKRSDTSDEGDDGGGKKRSRGRPRLDTKDVTAAERRRTQIRLAQRAYRNRKDTAIDTLKQRVKELEQANESMGREFMSLSNFVLGQGMVQGSPEVFQHINDATRKFMSLKSQAIEESSADADNDAGVDASIDSTVNPADDSSQPVILQQRGSKKSSSSSGSSNDVLSTPNTDWSIEEASDSLQVPVTFQPLSHMAQSSVNHITNPITNHSMGNSSFPVADTGAKMSLFTDPFAHSPFVPPPAPSSYAAHEISFGRRLQRTVLEAGLRLAGMDNPPPTRYMAVFSFCLYFESRRDIVRRLSESLQCTAQETLNNWKFAFTNLGGSGLHFPDNEGNGNMPGHPLASSGLPIGNHGLPEPFKPCEMTGYSIGPFNREIELTKDMRVDHRLRMLQPGFEGDFYDADEVEAYMRYLGIVIPPGRDYVDVEIVLSVLDEPAPLPFVADSRGFFKPPVSTPLETPNLMSLPPDFANAPGSIWPGAHPPITAPVQPSVMMNSPHSMAPMDPHLGSSVPHLATGTSTDQFNHTLASFDGAAGYPWRTWDVDPAWKTRVTIDVNQLVAKMTGMAVCLGRSPGLRPQDIHLALKQSIILEH